MEAGLKDVDDNKSEEGQGRRSVAGEEEEEEE